MHFEASEREPQNCLALQSEMFGKEARELSKILPPNSLSAQLDSTSKVFASILYKTCNQLCIWLDKPFVDRNRFSVNITFA